MEHRMANHQSNKNKILNCLFYANFVAKKKIPREKEKTLNFINFCYH